MTNEKRLSAVTTQEINDLIDNLSGWDHGHKTMIVSDTINLLKRLGPAQCPDLSELPPWEDPRVQLVYKMLCDPDLNEPPNPEEHWEGWVSRNIVRGLAALAPGNGAVEAEYRTCATCHAVLADGPQPLATYENQLPAPDAVRVLPFVIEYCRRIDGCGWVPMAAFDTEVAANSYLEQQRTDQAWPWIYRRAGVVSSTVQTGEKTVSEPWDDECPICGDLGVINDCKSPCCEDSAWFCEKCERICGCRKQSASPELQKVLADALNQVSQTEGTKP